MDRLVEIGKYLPAAELFRDIQQFKPALDGFIRCGAWDKARELARTAAPQFRCVCVCVCVCVYVCVCACARSRMLCVALLELIAF